MESFDFYLLKWTDDRVKGDWAWYDGKTGVPCLAYMAKMYLTKPNADKEAESSPKVCPRRVVRFVAREQIGGDRWGDKPFPLYLGDAGQIRLDSLVYLKTWDNPDQCEGGFTAIFIAVNTDKVISGFLRWVYSYRKRDLVINRVDASVEGFEGVLAMEGPDAWLDTHVSADFGMEPEGVGFQYHVYGGEAF